MHENRALLFSNLNMKASHSFPVASNPIFALLHRKVISSFGELSSVFIHRSFHAQLKMSFVTLLMAGFVSSRL